MSDGLDDLIRLIDYIDENLISLYKMKQLDDDQKSSLEVYYSSIHCLLDCANIFDEREKFEYYKSVEGLIIAIFAIFGEVAPSLPDFARRARQSHIQDVRPRRTNAEEEMIARVLKGDHGTNISLHKLSLSYAQELRSMGVDIQHKAVKERLIKMRRASSD